MSDDPETELRRLLREKHGIAASKIAGESRIVHDLGVYGDDAAELLHDLSVKFGTDLSALEDQWLDFFGTEAASLRDIMITIPLIVLCGGVAGVLVTYLNWPKLSAFGLALLFLAIGSHRWSRRFGKELMPVTVSGLAEIVRSGRWPHDPADVC